MARSINRDPSITQDNRASCIGNQRHMARRAKIQSNKIDRQNLKKDLQKRILEVDNEESHTTTN